MLRMRPGMTGTIAPEAVSVRYYFAWIEARQLTFPAITSDILHEFHIYGWRELDFLLFPSYLGAEGAKGQR